MFCLPCPSWSLLKPDLVVATHPRAGWQGLVSGWGWGLGMPGLEDRPVGEQGKVAALACGRCPSSSPPLCPETPSSHLQLYPGTQQHSDIVVMAMLGCPATSPWCTSHDRHGPIRMAAEKQVSPGQSPPSLPNPLPQVLVLITVIMVGKLYTPF